MHRLVDIFQAPGKKAMNRIETNTFLFKVFSFYSTYDPQGISLRRFDKVFLSIFFYFYYFLFLYVYFILFYFVSNSWVEGLLIDVWES